MTSSTFRYMQMSYTINQGVNWKWSF